MSLSVLTLWEDSYSACACERTGECAWTQMVDRLRDSVRVPNPLSSAQDLRDGGEVCRRMMFVI